MNPIVAAIAHAVSSKDDFIDVTVDDIPCLAQVRTWLLLQQMNRIRHDMDEVALNKVQAKKSLKELSSSLGRDRDIQAARLKDAQTQESALRAQLDQLTAEIQALSQPFSLFRSRKNVPIAPIATGTTAGSSKNHSNATDLALKHKLTSDLWQRIERVLEQRNTAEGRYELLAELVKICNLVLDSQPYEKALAELPVSSSADLLGYEHVLSALQHLVNCRQKETALVTRLHQLVVGRETLHTYTALAFPLRMSATASSSSVLSHADHGSLDLTSLTTPHGHGGGNGAFNQGDITPNRSRNGSGSDFLLSPSAGTALQSPSAHPNGDRGHLAGAGRMGSDQGTAFTTASRSPVPSEPFSVAFASSLDGQSFSMGSSWMQAVAASPTRVTGTLDSNTAAATSRDTYAHSGIVPPVTPTAPHRTNRSTNSDSDRHRDDAAALWSPAGGSGLTAPSVHAIISPHKTPSRPLPLRKVKAAASCLVAFLDFVTSRRLLHCLCQEIHRSGLCGQGVGMGSLDPMAPRRSSGVMGTPQGPLDQAGAVSGDIDGGGGARGHAHSTTKTNADTFIASELVSWLLKAGTVPSRSEGVLMGQLLLRTGFFVSLEPVHPSASFHDDAELLRFRQMINPVTGTGVKTATPHHVTDTPSKLSIDSESEPPSDADEERSGMLSSPSMRTAIRGSTPTHVLPRHASQAFSLTSTPSTADSSAGTRTPLRHAGRLEVVGRWTDQKRYFICDGVAHVLSMTPDEKTRVPEAVLPLTPSTRVHSVMDRARPTRYQIDVSVLRSRVTTPLLASNTTRPGHSRSSSLASSTDLSQVTASASTLSYHGEHMLSAANPALSSSDDVTSLSSVASSARVSTPVELNSGGGGANGSWNSGSIPVAVLAGRSRLLRPPQATLLWDAPSSDQVTDMSDGSSSTETTPTAGSGSAGRRPRGYRLSLLASSESERQAWLRALWSCGCTLSVRVVGASTLRTTAVGSTATAVLSRGGLTTIDPSTRTILQQRGITQALAIPRRSTTAGPTGAAGTGGSSRASPLSGDDALSMTSGDHSYAVPAGPYSNAYIQAMQQQRNAGLRSPVGSEPDDDDFYAVHPAMRVTANDQRSVSSTPFSVRTGSMSGVPSSMMSATTTRSSMNHRSMELPFHVSSSLTESAKRKPPHSQAQSRGRASVDASSSGVKRQLVAEGVPLAFSAARSQMWLQLANLFSQFGVSLAGLHSPVTLPREPALYARAASSSSSQSQQRNGGIQSGGRSPAVAAFVDGAELTPPAAAVRSNMATIMTLDEAPYRRCERCRAISTRLLLCHHCEARLPAPPAVLLLRAARLCFTNYKQLTVSGSNPAGSTVREVSVSVSDTASATSDHVPDAASDGARTPIMAPAAPDSAAYADGLRLSPAAAAVSHVTDDDHIRSSELHAGVVSGGFDTSMDAVPAQAPRPSVSTLSLASVQTAAVDYSLDDANEEVKRRAGADSDLINRTSDSTGTPAPAVFADKPTFRSDRSDSLTPREHAASVTDEAAPHSDGDRGKRSAQSDIGAKSDGDSVGTAERENNPIAQAANAFTKEMDLLLRALLRGSADHGSSGLSAVQDGANANNPATSVSHSGAIQNGPFADLLIEFDGLFCAVYGAFDYAEYIYRQWRAHRIAQVQVQQQQQQMAQHGSMRAQRRDSDYESPFPMSMSMHSASPSGMASGSHYLLQHEQSRLSRNAPTAVSSTPPAHVSANGTLSTSSSTPLARSPAGGKASSPVASTPVASFGNGPLGVSVPVSGNWANAVQRSQYAVTPVQRTPERSSLLQAASGPTPAMNELRRLGGALARTFPPSQLRGMLPGVLSRAMEDVRSFVLHVHRLLSHVLNPPTGASSSAGGSGGVHSSNGGSATVHNDTAEFSASRRISESSFTSGPLDGNTGDAAWRPSGSSEDGSGHVPPRRADTWLWRRCEEAIVSAVVERVSNTLLPLYVRRYRSQGALLTSRIQAHCHITLRQLGVSTGLQLEDTAFEPAVRCFARLAQQMNPRDMYQTVADLPGVICSCVDEAQLKSGKPLVIGADDLLLLFIFIIIRANVPDLHARIEFVNDFMYEFKSVTDGYYIATTQAAVEVLLCDQVLGSAVQDQTESESSAGAEHQSVHASNAVHRASSAITIPSDDDHVASAFSNTPPKLSLPEPHGLDLA